MANSENLRRLTPSEAREYGRRGGKASGEARRKKADFKKTLNALLTANIDHPEWTPVLEALGLDSTLEAAVNAAMLRAALSGDVRAYEAVAKYSGQAAKTDTDQEEQQIRMAARKAQMGAGDDDSQEDDGFLDAIAETAAKDWGDYGHEDEAPGI